MKRLLLTGIMLIYIGCVYAQNLSEKYQQDVIALKADPEFGSGNNWDEVFSDYQTKTYGKHVGAMKKIVVAPDGRVFMSHRSRHCISIFDHNGKHLKDFGQQGSKSSDFLYLPSVQGIIDNMLYTVDVNGRMMFFDLDGKFIKMMRLDYMPLNTVPLKNGKVAIQGHVPWKGRQSRKIIAIRDINSGEEKIIVSQFESYDSKQTVKVNMPPKGMMSWTAPFTHPSYTRDRIERTNDGNLLVASPVDGKVTIFSETGEKLETFSLKIDPLKISAEKKEEYHQNALKNFERFKKNMAKAMQKQPEYKEKYQQAIREYEKGVERFNEPGFMPDVMPLFSSIMIDTDNNLLVFEYTREKGSNSFHVYTFNPTGRHVATSSFSSDEYQLDISSSQMVFNNQSIIAVVHKKADEEMPLRLVKFAFN